MPDYKQMYFATFNAMSDAIEILQKAQQAGESAYIGEAGKQPAPLDDKRRHAKESS